MDGGSGGEERTLYMWFCGVLRIFFVRCRFEACRASACPTCFEHEAIRPFYCWSPKEPVRFVTPR